MARQRSDYPLDYETGPDRTGRPTESLGDTAAAQFKKTADNAQERIEQIAGQAREYAGQAQDALKQFKPFVEKSMKERPMATLAGFAFVGFVLGALWKK